MSKFNKPYGLKKLSLKKILRWKFGLLFKNRVKDDSFKMELCSINPQDLESRDDFIIWLGHATFYIQIDGVKILTDPVFWDVPFFKRLIKMPIEPKFLKPDIILISHGHYDHFDIKSLKALDIYKKQTKIIVPLNLSKYLRKGANVTELDWDEEFSYKGIKVTAVAAAHWHRRKLFDFNKSLWCSFLIESKDKSIFFAGDSAFDRHFEEIATKYKTDIALMPIGAYEPREIMQYNHMNPQEATDAAKILKAKKMYPYHYATFRLTEEPVGEPLEWIERLAKETKELEIKALKPGEVEKEI